MQRRTNNPDNHTLVHSRSPLRPASTPGQNSVGAVGQNSIGADRPHHSQRVDHRIGRCPAVRFGAPVRGVCRAGPAPVQYRRQANAAGHQQTRRQESAAAVGAMRAGHHATHRTTPRPVGGVGAQPSGSTALQRGRLRFGQQIGEDRLGHPRQRDTLPRRTGCCRSLTRCAAYVPVFTQSLPGFATRDT